VSQAVGPTNVTVNLGNIVIAFNATTTFAQGDTIVINAVRVDVSSFAQVNNTLQVVVSSVLGQATVTNPQVLVAVFVEPITINVMNGISFFQDGRGDAVTTTVRISEAGSFTNAFETKGPGANDTHIILQFSGIPTGLKLLSPQTITYSGTAGVIANTDASTNLATGLVVVNIDLQNANSLDYLDVTVTFTSTSTNIPLNPPAGTVTATLGPAAVGAPAYALPLRYASRLVTGSLPFTIFPLVSTLVAQFNVVDPGSATSSPFDTGITITNMSGVFFPYVGDSGTTFDDGLPGTIRVDLYPYDGSGPLTVQTSAANHTLGIGLDANGRLPAKGTWEVLVSQLIAAVGITNGKFSGMIVFSCNFPEGTGINYIADPLFKVQAQGYPMVVVDGFLPQLGVWSYAHLFVD